VHKVDAIILPNLWDLPLITNTDRGNAYRHGIRSVVICGTVVCKSLVSKSAVVIQH